MPKQTFFALPDEKRNRILNVAIEEFSAKPYDTASISNIVRNSDIAKGSFYQYFIDKKDLYQYLIEFANSEKVQLMKGMPIPDPNADLFEYFRWLFQSTVYFEIRYPDLARIVYRAFIEEVPFPEMTEELRRRGTTQFFKQLLTQGIHHGDINPWTDPDLAAFFMETVYYQFGRYFIERLQPALESQNFDQIFSSAEAQELLDNLITFLKQGLH